MDALDKKLRPFPFSSPQKSRFWARYSWNSRCTTMDVTTHYTKYTENLYGVLMYVMEFYENSCPREGSYILKRCYLFEVLANVQLSDFKN